MSRVGKIFTVKSLHINHAEIMAQASGDRSKWHLATYLFLYRHYRGNKDGLAKVRLEWREMQGTWALAMQALPGEEAAFSRFCQCVKRHRYNQAAVFFIWGRSHKELIRKVPYRKVWDFTQKRREASGLVIPLDASYAKKLSQRDGYLTVCAWVPHQVICEGAWREQQIKIASSWYPAREDWRQVHEVYLEWAEQRRRLELPCQEPATSPSAILHEIVQELGAEFEEEVERTQKVLQSTLLTEFPARYSFLLEKLAGVLDEGISLTAEQRLRAISLGLFGD